MDAMLQNQEVQSGRISHVSHIRLAFGINATSSYQNLYLAEDSREDSKAAFLLAFLMLNLEPSAYLFLSTPSSSSK